MENSNNIVWHHVTVTRSRRMELNAHKSVVLWFTGLSGSGKSTLVDELEEHQHRRIFGRRNFSGLLSVGIKDTQEMLDFCGEHNINSDIELIPIQEINEAYDRLVKSDVKYRFEIDMDSLPSEP